MDLVELWLGYFMGPLSCQVTAARLRHGLRFDASYGNVSRIDYAFHACIWIRSVSSRRNLVRPPASSAARTNSKVDLSVSTLYSTPKQVTRTVTAAPPVPLSRRLGHRGRSTNLVTCPNRKAGSTGFLVLVGPTQAFPSFLFFFGAD